jgi:GxxExxY protein
MEHDHIVTDRVIGCAIEVHRALGPGLLERAYLLALCAELAYEGIDFERERSVPLQHRGVDVGTYIPDLIVERKAIIEVKAVPNLDPIFTAQLLTYLRITNLHVGLLLNFNRPKLMDGIKRVVL